MSADMHPEARDRARRLGAARGRTMSDADAQLAGMIDQGGYEAVLFDLDGVLTETATVHAAAWKSMFDTFLQSWADSHGQPFVAFDVATDYPRYVDGKPRYEGVRSFLASRSIELPDGTP